MTKNHQQAPTWDQYAATAPGFLGAALRRQRMQAFLTREQQRALLGILDGKYDQFWRRLQTMPLPRQECCLLDLERIVAKVGEDVGVGERATVDLAALSELIHDASQ